MFDKLSKNVGEALDFPPDVAGNGPKITITGRQEVLVENYQDIVEFTTEEIRLSTLEGELCLTGRGFILKTVLATELRIEGELDSLTFQGGSEG
ncbi:YabP/YqfC family sporulation protein [Desulfitobacterium metallireducens]|uniref:Sporulation protein YqfC n=1 Tax=Desulfitobacterium metallireducens DSM 15288 TaxID=871968 RepID=W0EEB3_9FIRM|nr:YabP/YqfC family sporulation protein [Desulfitobacterium metallireducens]AHF07853.1 sporulation protein YqfC [Desulfitobacterium metallireducens DSM 15288]